MPTRAILKVARVRAIVAAQVSPDFLVDYSLDLPCCEKVLGLFLVRLHDFVGVMLVADVTQDAHLVLRHRLAIEKPLELVADYRAIPSTALQTEMASAV